MKPTKLIIRNIGKLAGETIIEINKPLILFYGEIKQGKTTILNAVRWVCGGEFPQDIISHNAKGDGEIELHFDGGMISRSFYKSKDGSTKSRPVVFIRNGKPVASPVSEIKRLLNPFLLDQDFLRNKNELERKRYFTELFAVDSSDLDTELFNIQRDASAIRSKISAYGEIDLTKVEPVDASSLKIQLGEIRNKYNSDRQFVETKNREAMERNARVLRAKEAIVRGNGEIAKLRQQMEQIEAEINRNKEWLLQHPEATETPTPLVPDTSELEKQIQDAGATNVRAEQYQKNLARDAQRKADEKKLAELEARQKAIKLEKQSKLQSIEASCGIKGLKFDEDGNFIYDGTTAGMISDSQIMRLSSELSALYPDGFGLDLIDRAESLGKSIFEFVDKAKAEKKSILATIVGEKPAKVPADIGVFVVDNGKITDGQLL